MWSCRICRFLVELDDVALALTDGRCICVRCFARETGGAIEMPKTLRRELVAALAAPEHAAG